MYAILLIRSSFSPTSGVRGVLGVLVLASERDDARESDPRGDTLALSIWQSTIMVAFRVSACFSVPDRGGGGEGGECREEWKRCVCVCVYVCVREWGWEGVWVFFCCS
eukprot:Rhum_TRINITY_DN15035_c0_g1::Rhum_TRINITY_DN15035_c0_g1_i1::g.134781::m.134781